MSASDSILVETVHNAYSAKAKAGVDISYAKTVAGAFGYSLDELQSIPAEANLGLSCGNPVAAATLKEGETVLDLGSGGGIDVFLATSKVGPTGQVVGLDMSADMISLARRNASRQNLKPPQVSFVQAALTEPLPIASNSVDCILSNCVINLLPNSGKAALLKETARVLKPGGRIVLDDMIAKQPLPDDLLSDLAAYIGCISGAVTLNEYKAFLKDAGFPDAIFVDSHTDINVYNQFDESAGCNGPVGCCGPTVPAVSSKPAFDANAWVASYQIYAVKPMSQNSGSEISLSPTPLLRWWDAFPVVQSHPPTISAEELVDLIRNASDGDYAVIDVRHDDHKGGHVRGSFQWPAQTFYNDLPKFIEKFVNVKKVAFYCGSSSGRGPRCAGWYQDRLNEQGISASAAYVLQGGMKAWLSLYADDVELVSKD